MSSPVVTDLTPRELLALYARILDELLRRNLIRTRNAPAGDYAEALVARALDGTLEPNSTKSWDVTTPTGQRVQVKARVVGPSTPPSAKYSVFRSWGFDTAVFVTFDQGTYEVKSAVSVPAASIESKSRFSAHVAGSTISIGTKLLALPGAENITALVRAVSEQWPDQAEPSQ